MTIAVHPLVRAAALGAVALCPLVTIDRATAQGCPTTVNFSEYRQTTSPGGGFNGQTNQFITKSGAAAFRVESFSLNAPGQFDIYYGERNQNVSAQSGSGASNPSILGTVNGIAIFVAFHPAYGRELWRSDGTAAGTYLLKDFMPGTSGMSYSILDVVGNALFFGASTPTAGMELWKTDGTVAGTVLVKDIYTGSGSSNPVRGKAMGPFLFFQCNSKYNGVELWRSNGTEAGTVLVKDIAPGYGSSYPMPSWGGVVGGNLLFFASDGSLGYELWRTDGTPAGTALVKDIWPGRNGQKVLSSTIVAGGSFFFPATDGMSGFELWKSDGTTAGTVMVKDIHPGSGSSLGYNSTYMMTALGGEVYLRADDGTSGNELWKTDGTAAGTVMVKDIYPGASGSSPYVLATLGSSILFRANDGASGYELWKSDGTPGGTVLVKDINPGSANGSPALLRPLNGYLVGYANDGIHGYELWKTDGTAAGTVMVKDITPGANTSITSWFYPFAGSRLIGYADDGTHGRELWATDGTAAGTVMVKNIAPEGGLTGLRGLRITRVDGGSFDLASMNLYGQVAIGQMTNASTGAGTWTLFTGGGYYYNGKYIDFGAQFDDVTEIYLVDPFAAGGTNSYNIWDNLRLDAKAELDPVKSSVSASPWIVSSFGGESIVTVRPKNTCYQDLGPGQEVVIETNAGSMVDSVVDHGNGLYSQKLRAAPGFNMATVWATVNGNLLNSKPQVLFVPVDVETSTVEVSPTKTVPSGQAVVTVTPKDDKGNPVGPGFDVSISSTRGSWQGPVIDNGDGTYSKTLLATSVGTAYITASVRGLALNDSASLAVVDPASLGIVVGLDAGSNVYPYSGIQEAIDDSVTRGLRRILILPQTFEEIVLLKKQKNLSLEGLTSKGVITVRGLVLQQCTGIQISGLDIDASIATGPGRDGIALKPHNKNVVISGCLVHDAGQNHHGIVVYPHNMDVTILNCQVANNARHGMWLMSECLRITVQGCSIRANGWCGAYVENTCRATFRYNQIGLNGNPAVPMLVKDINPGSGSSSPGYLAALGETVFFRAYKSGEGYELWKSDGTEAGTIRVKDIVPGYSGSYPANFTAMGDTMFFTASSNGSSSTSYHELWKTDGTEAGTVMVKDVYPGYQGSSPSYLTAVAGTLFFRARNSYSNYELWKSDGTAEGTVMVRDIRPGSYGSYPGALAALGDLLLFSASDGVHGTELWRSDGTVDGTVMVKDIRSGSASSSPSHLATINGVALFEVYGSSGYELWKTDGTAEGTVFVKALNPTSGNSIYMGTLNGVAFFSANDGSSGNELWKSDGTTAGTLMVKDIYPGYGSSSPAFFATLNGEMLFRANNPASGYELWKTDGTAAGTVLVQDIRGGSSSSNPIFLATMGGYVYFTAADTVSGPELWRSDGTAAGTEMVGDIRPGFYGSFPLTLTVAGDSIFFAADDGKHGRELWKFEAADPKGIHVKDGYGIMRQRVDTDEIHPEWLTLISNTFTNNNGEVIAGQCTKNLGNYDQILDTGDAQSGY